MPIIRYCLLAVLGCLNLGCDPKPAQTTSGTASSHQAVPPPHELPDAVLAPPDKTLPNKTPLHDEAPANPGDKRRFVTAALGDSITDKKSGGGGFLRHAEASCPESIFLNFGRGGDMTNQMLRRLKNDILPRVVKDRIDTLIVFGGVNDLYSDLTAGRKNEVIERDLSAIYALARGAGLRVVAITVSPWGGFSKYWTQRRGENTKLLNSWMMGLVASNKLDLVVDSFPLLSCGQPDILCPEYENRHRDGLHPGPLGHTILGKKLVEIAFPDCR